MRCTAPMNAPSPPPIIPQRSERFIWCGSDSELREIVRADLRGLQDRARERLILLVEVVFDSGGPGLADDFLPVRDAFADRDGRRFLPIGGALAHVLDVQ